MSPKSFQKLYIKFWTFVHISFDLDARFLFLKHGENVFYFWLLTHSKFLDVNDVKVARVN